MRHPEHIHRIMNLLILQESDSSSTCLVPLDVIRQTKPYLYSATNNLFETFAAEWDSDFVILDLVFH